MGVRELPPVFADRAVCGKPPHPVAHTCTSDPLLASEWRDPPAATRWRETRPAGEGGGRGLECDDVGHFRIGPAPTTRRDIERRVVTVRRAADWSTVEPRSQPRPLMLGSLAAVVWAVALALTLGIANSSTVPSIDATISDKLDTFSHANEWVVPIARFFALMGSGAVLFPITVAVVLALIRHHRWWAAWVAACGLGGLLISQTVKRTVDRERPQWPAPFDSLDSASFPSGHSMAGIYGWVVFGVVALMLLRHPWNRVVGSALITFGVLMGPSRAFLGVHWPTDVLAGWLFATAWVLTVSAALLWWRGARSG